MSVRKPDGAPDSPTNRRTRTGPPPGDHADCARPPPPDGRSVVFSAPRPDRPQAALGGVQCSEARPAEHSGLKSGPESADPPAQLGGSGPKAPGLVSTETSDTRIQVFRHEGRLKRMKRSVLTTARLLQEDMQQGGFRGRIAMLTLTYRPEVEWEQGQLTSCIKAVRQYLARRGETMRYVSVMELHKSGKPHYHLLIWLPRGVTLPKPDKRGWWRYGMTKIEWARNALGYVAKYASKGADGRFPKGARLTTSGGLSRRARFERAWWLAPGWVRDAFSVEDRPVRAPGGGWVSRITGDWLPSPWRLVDRALDWSWLVFEPVEAG